MKTYQTFQDRVPDIKLIVKSFAVSEFRSLIEGIGKAEVVQEVSPEKRGDSYHFFHIKNCVRPLLLFFQSQPDKCHVHQYVLAFTDTIRVDFSMNERNEVENFYIKRIVEKRSDGSERWVTIAEVFNRKREFLSKEIARYEVNWPSIGTVSVETAKEFADGLMLAVNLAKECEEQYAVKPQEAV